MSRNKFFSFIHGGSVHAAPKTKFIPGEEISVLQNAEEILEKVKMDAQRYKKEVVAETEKQKEAAHQEGFEQGFQQWLEHIAKLEEEIVKVRQDLEKQILPIAIKAAQKIVSKELELFPNTIADIVASNLKAVAQHKQITIYVSKKDFAAVESQRPRLKDLFEQLEVLSIRERADISPGGCVIETEGGIINAQIESKWKILENVFESRMKTK